MGGYLFPYVLLNLLCLLYVTWDRRSKKLAMILLAFFVMTIFVAFLPASHELRYYSFWMVTLVGLNLYVLWNGIAAADPHLPQIHAALCLACGLFVGSMTGFSYVLPQHFSIQRLMSETQIQEKYISKIEPGRDVCVVSLSKEFMLLAPYFHRDIGPYSLQVVQTERECATNSLVLKF